MKQKSNLGNFKARAWTVRRGMSLLRRASSSVERKSVTPGKKTGCNRWIHYCSRCLMQKSGC